MHSISCFRFNAAKTYVHEACEPDCLAEIEDAITLLPLRPRTDFSLWPCLWRDL